MPPRAYWKGYLKLSLVTCQVEMMPAVTGAEQVRFRTINRATGNRVQAQWVDSVTRAPVEEGDEARGYETEDGQFLILEDEDFEAIAVESARTIAIEAFVDEDSIGWIWRDSPNYLLPSDPVGVEAYAVIRDAMAASGTVGIAKLVLGRRERAVMLVPKDKGIVLWTLRFADEVRDPDDYFPDTLPDTDKATVAMLQKVIRKGSREWDPAMVTDPMQDRLLELVEDKRKGLATKPAAAPDVPAAHGKVVNIMDALKRSLAAEAKTR